MRPGTPVELLIIGLLNALLSSSATAGYGLTIQQ